MIREKRSGGEQIRSKGELTAQESLFDMRKKNNNTKKEKEEKKRSHVCVTVLEGISHRLLGKRLKSIERGQRAHRSSGSTTTINLKKAHGGGGVANSALRAHREAGGLGVHCRVVRQEEKTLKLEWAYSGVSNNIHESLFCNGRGLEVR